MFENEEDYFTALGLEPPTGGNEQEVADPDGSIRNSEFGMRNEEDESFMEPGAEEDVVDPDDEAGSEEDGQGVEDVQAQSKEQRAQNAARRRQQEREQYAQQAVERALAQEREKTKDLFTKAGFKDGKTPITSLDEMQAYLDKQQQNRLQRELKAGKLSPESLQQVVADEIRKQQPAQPTGQDPAFMQQVAAELAEIRKYDPNVKEVKDLLSLDRKDAFLDAVNNHGYGYLDAYRFVYADRIAERGARQEAQRNINNIRSKSHLQSSGAKGAGDVQIPAAVERNIRALMPNATPKEIREFYRRDAKRFG